MSKEVDVRMFGAKGDGVTDDTVAIQHAIDKLSGSGASLLFPPGIYLVSATKRNPYKLILRSDLHLIGCGASSEIRSEVESQNCSARTFASEKGTMLKNCTLENLKINGRESEQTQRCRNYQRSAIFVLDSEDFRVIDCEIVDSCDVIRLYGPAVRPVIRGNRIHAQTEAISREAIVISGATDALVEGNHIWDCPYMTGIKMEGASNDNDFRNKVVHNFISAGMGITVAGACTVEDNEITTTNGAAISAGSRCFVTRNRILGAIQNGIALVSYDGELEDTLIAWNKIFDVVGSGTGYPNGICAVGTTENDIRPRRLQIVGNTVRGLTGGNDGINFGIRLEAVGTTFLIAHNELYGVKYGVSVGLPRGTSENPRYMENVRALGNLIELAAVTGAVGIQIGGYSSSYSFVRRILIANNTIYRTDSNYSSEGLQFQSDADGVIISGNDLRDNGKPYQPYGANPTNVLRRGNLGLSDS